MTYTTDRLLLRPYAPHDYESWMRGHEARQAPASRHDGAPLKRTEASQESFERMVERQAELAAKDETYHYGVFDKAGNHLGHIDLHIVKRENYNWAWIGYSIHNQHQHNGYGTEAVRAAVKQIGFDTLGLKRIEAVINTDNAPSIRMAQQCGFEFEWTKKEFIYEFGAWCDNHIYVVLNKDKTSL